MRTLFTVSALALAIAANATTFNSFYQASIHGISVARSGGNFTVGIQNGAYINYGGSKYNVVNGFGFYSIGDHIDLTPSFSGNTQLTNWSYDESNSKSGKVEVGSIAGWIDASKKSPILIPGASALTFGYPTYDASKITGYGFHLSLDRPLAGSGAAGNTFDIRGDLNPVPEPASFAVLGVGALALLRRRKSA